MAMITVTVKRPPAPRNFAQIFNELALTEGTRRAKTMERAFRASTNTWKPEHKPAFTSGCALQGGRKLIVYAGYDDQTEAGRIYRYVDLGVGPHAIDSAGPDRPMRFMSTELGEYSPHTQPGRLQSVPRVYEGEYVFPHHVDHPGIEAREFTRQVQERHGNVDWIEASLRQAFIRAGFKV